jgi:putative pyruvate formate lyase activating enzyme
MGISIQRQDDPTVAAPQHPFALEERRLFRLYGNCELCPRTCRVDRASGQEGVCRQSDELRIAAIEAHLGEEPPISGQNGSGTVFFAGCSLHCRYCQNYQISKKGLGRLRGVDEVVAEILALHRATGIHNVNFVTPDHFFPHTVAIANGLKKGGLDIPIVFNTSGYQRVESLRLIQSAADIYLPDFKFSDASLAQRLSGRRDYPSVALDALSEMVRQKGHLDSFSRREDSEAGCGASAGSVPLAKTGVLVRHLILPGLLQNSMEALTMLLVEFGPSLPLSLMSQYVPVHFFTEFPSLNRSVTREEFEEVFQHAISLGFRNLFVQFPEGGAAAASSNRPFLPDFNRKRPFAGNLKS